MNVNFYSAFFSLAGEDRRVFEILCEEDETLEKTISDCAGMWRARMRSVYPDHVMCRQVFLARSVVIAAKHVLKSGGGGRQVAAAFALYICDRIEQRVSQLDREEQNAL